VHVQRETAADVQHDSDARHRADGSDDTAARDREGAEQIRVD
jgi:hypothetical protein